LTFKLCPRRSKCTEAAGRLGHIVKCALICRPDKLGAVPTAGIRGVRYMVGAGDLAFAASNRHYGRGGKLLA
jgi:hypothetical protein